MDAETAQAVNDHLGLAFNHLQEAIMLALTGGPPSDEIGGAMGRLERFVATGDTAILTEGLFDDEQFSVKVEEPAREYEDTPLTPTEIIQAAEDLGAIIAKAAEEGELDTDFLPEPDEEEEDEFSGLFDDIDEDDDTEDGPSDAPAAF